jgi:hypothetical protein
MMAYALETLMMDQTILEDEFGANLNVAPRNRRFLA